jgi:two-component system, chemotaxis family, sensor kinase CheA
MNLEPELLQQLLATFRVELEEQLQLISDGLLQLEQDSDKSAQQDHLNNIFRAAHNIKGAARGLDITDLTEISHHLENLFSMLRSNNRSPSTELIDLCLLAIDQMRAGMIAFDAGEPYPNDLQGLLLRLDEAAENTQTSPAEQKANIETQLTQPQQAQKQTQAAEEEQQQDSEPPSTTPPVQAKGQEEHSIIHVKTADVDAVAALLENVQVTKIEMDTEADIMRQLCSQTELLSKPWARLKPGQRINGEAQLPDDLIELLKLSSEAIPELNKTATKAQQMIRSSSRHLGIQLTSLQNHMRVLRLVPVANLLSPLTRSVRDIARELNKKVKLETSGEDTQIDRAVLAQLRDPLTHLLRNAVDHGIEPLEQRRSTGKSETGRIALRVWREGNQVIMAVEDDGAGISPENIIDIAIKKNLISATEAESLGREQTFDLLFRPGFSSKQIITEISGRGVGLDVVRANLSTIKGRVELDTEVGRGSIFTLRVPLTLSTDHGLLIRSGESVFAIPLVSVDCIIDLDPDDIIQVEAGEAILRDGKAIPLRSLGRALELTSDGPDRGHAVYHVVVVSSGWNAVALIVDEVIGQQELVIKPLNAPLLSVRNVAGGTFTSSGGVVLVLNPRDLVDSALQAGRASRLSGSRQAESEVAAPKILVVDDSLTTRTLEKNILENNGYHVTVAVNGREGWETLQDNQFDLVVTDIQMPIMDGFELTEHIKHDKNTEKMPVVVVTSMAKEEDKRRGIEVGADAYIVKSQFETRTLLDVVRQLI